MANYTANDIKQLRDATGAGMLDVKKALDEANGDVSKATELIRIKGLKGVAKREGRATSEGLVVADVANEGSDEVGYLVELNSETDFVAKSQKFIDLGNTILKAVIDSKSDSVQAALEAKSPEGSVEELVNNNAAVLGEKVVLKNVIRLSSEAVTLYLHKTAKDLPPTVGVLVGTNKAGKDAGKDIAQHIAALSPSYLNRDEIPAETVEAEKRVAEEIAKKEGKPEQIIPKIVEGRLNGFYKDTVLVDQPLAKDPGVTVGKFVSANGGAITAFARVRVGQE